jgi:hypothetical protein
MTLDQALLLLADRKILKTRMGSRKGVMKEPLAMAAKADKDGKITGRAADGTVIKGVIRGKSVARQLMEQEEAKKQKQGRRRRRKGR